DRRAAVADAGPVPHRRLQPAQRPAHAAQQAAHRRLRRPGLLHPRLRASGGQGTVTSVSTTAGADWEYAATPAAREIVTIQREYNLFTGGEFVPPATGEFFTTLNPASEEPLARVAQAGEADVDRAVAAARKAFETSWGRLPGRERAKYLYRIARAIQERAREFPLLEPLHNRKPI